MVLAAACHDFAQQSYLFLNHQFSLLHLILPDSDVGLHFPFYVLQVVERHVLHVSHTGVDVAGEGQVDSQQRAVGVQVFLEDDGMVGRGGAD